MENILYPILGALAAIIIFWLVIGIKDIRRKKVCLEKRKKQTKH